MPNIPKCPHPAILDHIDKYFRYDPITGIMRRVLYDGKLYVTGSDNGKRLTCTILYKTIVIHHIAWYVYYGYWPKLQIDHRDINYKNNNIHNLREVTDTINGLNKTNTSKYPGIHYHKNTRTYGASIICRGIKHSLGYHTTKELAHEAYKKAFKELHGIEYDNR